MALRPAVQALKDFGPLDYEPETDERFAQFMEFYVKLDTLIPTLTDKEVEVVVWALGPLDDDFYGAKFALMYDMEKTPGWPHNILKLNLPDEGICWTTLTQRARLLLWRTEWIYRVGALYTYEHPRILLKLNYLRLNTRKSTRLSMGASPWIKTFPVGLPLAPAQG